jgi:cell division protein FtsI (penicillin-binding protein 3)
LAGPVFREVATKLYAMYVQKKDPAMYAIKTDSTAYFYAGNTKDIKNVYQTLGVNYSDSAQQSEWSHVYANNYSQNPGG